MELLPCPFCGSTDIKEGVSYTYCDECDGRSSIGCWNTRHSPWISVKDRLPEKDMEYLCLLENGKNRVIPYLKEYGFINTYVLGVTHWMPLPLLSEEK